MFVDKVVLTLRAGSGGDGVVAWRREKFIPKGGPAGGDGGQGGSITLQADTQAVSLEDFRNRRIIAAKNGMPGSSSTKKGKNGDDLLLKVPCGTLVKDATTGEILFDLTTPDSHIRICQGGKGGRGNFRFRSPTHQAPNICEEGTSGESKEIELELKLIADVGLIGIPNAGKSSLMSKITPLEVKIGAYPFTTLFPNLSYIQFEDQSRILIADIPGIIEGAHQNRGLGLEFLRHIERTKVLLFVVDISGWEGRSPIGDFTVLQEELRNYDPSLLKRPFLIVINKIDLEGANVHDEEFIQAFSKHKDRIFTISAENGVGIEELKMAIQAACPKPESLEA